MRRIFRRVVRTATTVTWTVTYSDDGLTPEPQPKPSPGRLPRAISAGLEAEPAEFDQHPDPDTDQVRSPRRSDRNRQPVDQSARPQNIGRLTCVNVSW